MWSILCNVEDKCPVFCIVKHRYFGRVVMIVAIIRIGWLECVYVLRLVSDSLYCCAILVHGLAGLVSEFDSLVK
jgi:hypothetical protein